MVGEKKFPRGILKYLYQKKGLLGSRPTKPMNAHDTSS